MNLPELRKLQLILLAPEPPKPGVTFDLSDLLYVHNNPPTRPNHWCGTSACALGYAAISGQWKDLGVEWDAYTPLTGPEVFYPTYNVSSIFGWASETFDLNDAQCEILFETPSISKYPMPSPQPLDVARRIEALIRAEGDLDTMLSFEQDLIKSQWSGEFYQPEEL